MLRVADELTKRDYELLADFRYQLRKFIRISEELSKAHGITVLQYLLLLQIKGFPGRSWATIVELAERLQSHHHGIVSLATRCEKLGLIARRPGRDDKRLVEVHLTKKGEKLLQKLAVLHKDQLLRQGRELLIPDVNMFSSFEHAEEQNEPAEGP